MPYRRRMSVPGLVVFLLAVGPSFSGQAPDKGNPLPEGAVARLGDPQFRFTGLPPAVAFSPDSKVLAVAPRGEERALFLWDLVNGKALRTLGLVPDVHSLAFSADGKLLAVADERGVLVFEVGTGNRLAHSFQSSKVFVMTFAPRGTTLALGGAIQRDGIPSAVVLWDAATGKETAVLSGHKSPVHALTFTRDGKHLVACSVTAGDIEYKPVAHGQILRFDLATNKSVKLMNFPAKSLIYPGIEAFAPLQPLHAVRLAPDGAHLAFFDQEESMIVWDVNADRELMKVPADNSSGVFTPDSKSLIVGGRTPISRIDLTAPENALRFEGQREYYGTFVRAVSPDGKLAVSAGDLRLWSRSLHLWDLEQGRERFPTVGHLEGVTSLAFSGDGKVLVSGGRDRSVIRWELETKTHQRLPTETEVGAVAVSTKTDIMAALGQDGGLELWSGGKGTALLPRKPLNFDEFVPTMEFGGAIGFASDNSTLIAVLRDQLVERHSVRLGPARQRFRLSASPNRLLMGGAVSPDGERLVTSLASTIDRLRTLGLWQSVNGRKLWEQVLPNNARVGALAFSPDGSAFAASEKYFDEKKNEWSHPAIRLRETDTGQPIATVQLAGPSPTALALALDGRTLAWVYGEDTDAPPYAVIWDILANKELGRLKGHDGPMTALAFAPGSNLLATGSADHTILLWDVRRWLVRPTPKTELPADELESCWKAMLSRDADVAWQALWKLADAPTPAVAFLGKHLQRSDQAIAKQIRQWILDLNDPRYPIREKASVELTRLNLTVEPALRETLKGNVPLETRRRIEQILQEIEELVLTPEQLRVRRGLTVLEWIGTVEARRILEGLASGSDMTAYQARSALQRLAHRPR